MEESFFTKFRKLASSLNDAEEEIRRKEKLDVDGSEHYALQQNAIERFRQAVSTTKANMKTLQPTVLHIQHFSQLNSLSQQLIALHRTRVDAVQTRFCQYGYEPPTKQPRKEESHSQQPEQANVEGKENAVAPENNDYAVDNQTESDGMSAKELQSCENLPNVCDLLPPSNSDSSSPEAPKTPILKSTSQTRVDPLYTTEATNGCNTSDDSILAMELPPTPVCPELLTVEAENIDLTSVPATPVTSHVVAHTPTPPVLRSLMKKPLDLSQIDFSALGEGEVFHTGMTPKTPVLKSVLTSDASISRVPVSALKEVELMATNPRTVLDTPLEGRATPTSPQSQQSIENLKRTLQFNGNTAAPQRPVNFIKLVSFTEFEQRDQKLEGINRELINNGIKKLNVVFREKNASKEPLDLSQAEVVSLFNEGCDQRLGTKILLMLLKFNRLDCRCVGGQSFVSPSSDADDSLVDQTVN